MRKRAGLLIVALILALCLGCEAQRVAPEVNTYMVPMRDGVKLSTSAVFPKGEGPWPAVLTRTPYGKAGGLMSGAGVARRGYVRVVQDMRGRFDSEGEDMPFLTDAWGQLQDGYDTIQWIANQPWCDGNVGMIGGSATGITQYMAAGAVPEALKCCHAAVAASSLYHHACFQGGAFRKALVENWMGGNEFRPEAFDLLVANPNYNELWQTADLVARAGQVATPMVHIGGWYDVFAQGTLDAFMALQHNGGEGAKGNQILVFGPWVHGCKPGGELRFPASAGQNPTGSLTEAWFNKWLRGKPSAVLDGPPVHYYVMGACEEPGAPGNEWRNVEDWPPPATPTPLYLHAVDTPLRNGEGPGVRQSFRASFEPPQDQQASLAFQYDPADPVPTIGGCNLTMKKGPMDQRPAENREDVLLFTTNPLEEPIEVTGRVFAKLWVSSDCPDTDFTAKLTDVYPDGRSMLICDGILRMRHRNSFEAEEFMEPAEVCEASIDLWSTSIIFNKGHRILIAISSSNSPRFDPNPNTDAGFRENDETRIATNTLHLDEKHPSQILLPLPDSRQ